MNKKHHSGVFMMEMICVVFFFILCASICIMIFVKSDQMSRRASSMNEGVMVAQSVAEVWKSEGVDGLTTHFLAEDAGSGSNVYQMLFDEKGVAVSTDHAVYTVMILLSEDKTAAEAEITVSRSGEMVYQLHAVRHEASE